MTKGTKIIITAIIFFVMISSINILDVNAATANVNVSSATVAQNATVTVTVRISSNVDISNYHLHFDYDSNILEYQSGGYGGGGGKFQLYSDATTRDDTHRITFIAKAPGTSAISQSGGGVYALNPEDGDIMTLSGGSGSVTVSAPSNASTNNNLSSLVVSAITNTGASKRVTLSPAFSPGVVNYSATVDSDVNRLSISANPEDAKSTTRVEWANLDPGSNKTYIRVTAENGSVKTYTINTTVGEGTTEESTEETPDETTETPAGDFNINVAGTTMTPAALDSSVTLPEGFELTNYSYKDKEITVAKDEVKGLVLFYLTDSVSGESNFYIYEEDRDLFYKYQTIEVRGATYTIIYADDTVAIPNGYKKTIVTINDVDFEGWLNDTEQEFALIYAMNPEGEKNVYMYDFKEGTIQRLNEKLYAVTNNDTDELEESKGGLLNNLFNPENLLALAIFAALIILCIILIILCIVFYRRSKRYALNDYEEYSELENNNFFETHKENDDNSPGDEAITREETENVNSIFVTEATELNEDYSDASEELENINSDNVNQDGEIAEGVITAEELESVKKELEDIINENESTSFGKGGSVNNGIDLLDDDFEILDADYDDDDLV